MLPKILSAIYNWFTSFDIYFYIMILPVLFGSFFISRYSRTIFQKYSNIRIRKNISGKTTARFILDTNGLQDVEIKPISGFVTDCYVHDEKSLYLSDGVAEDHSIMSVSIAAHETGHAIAKSKSPYMLWKNTRVVPIMQMYQRTNHALIPLKQVLCSMFLCTGKVFINFSILFFAACVILGIAQIIEEADASRRAVLILGKNGLVSKPELVQCKKVLGTALSTYGIGLVFSIVSLIRLLLLV